MTVSAVRQYIRRILLLLPVVLVTALWAASPDELATLRKGDIAVDMEPPRMPETENKDIKRARNYPMQPPTIPHKTNGYQVVINVNKCLSCHSRRQSQDSQAPMISLTHYQDRDGNFLADVSTRRYFCEQCHVVQTESRILVANDFIDIDELLREDQR